MIRRERLGELVCECEDCGAEYRGGITEEFRDFIGELRDAGWKIAKDEDGEFVHCCPECR